MMQTVGVVPLTTRLNKLLESQAGDCFVGRGAELSLLETLFGEAAPLVIHIQGLAGVGKSTLLDAFIRRARRRRSIRLVRLDCRVVEPTERGVLHAFSALLGIKVQTLAALTTRLGAPGKRVVLILDNYEVFRLLDTWIRQVFVPALPGNARLVLAGRESPVSAWGTAPEWAGLFCGVALRPLNDSEAGELLRRAGVAATAVSTVNTFARGHPLALRLAAQMFLRNPNWSLGEVAVGGVVEQLTQRYLSDIEDPLTLTALNAAAVVRRTTRSVLGAMLGRVVVEEAFERLSLLPFVERDRDGLFLHEAVRVAVAALLHSNDPATYRDHRRAAWRQLRAEIRSAGLAELWRYTADLMYLIENPIVREAFFPSQAQHLIVEPARREDKPAIDTIIERHDNAESAVALKRWWSAMPGAFHAVREGSGALCGFYCMFERGAIEHLAPAYDDPVVRKWLAHGKGNPPPSDQRTLLLRRWLGAEDGEHPSAVQAACFLDIKRTYMEMRPQLRRVYLAICDAALWQSPLQKLRFQMLPEFDAEMNGARYHTAMLDFGPGSVDGWLSALAADELGVDGSDLLDVGARRLNVDGDQLALTRLEFQVFEFLMQRQGQAVSRDVLRKAVWEHRGNGASNVVDAVVKSLRKKLGSRAPMIESVSGIGYRFCPERRLATMLFVGIVGSTERAVALGDARWRALLDTFYTEVSRVVGCCEGRIVNTAGDGTLATFDAPAAALRSACTIRDAMAAHGVGTRAGVHTGECEVIGDDITGIAVHLAARIAAAAGAGEVLASGTVRDLVAGSGIAFADRGLHHLKGVPGKHPLVAVGSQGEENTPRTPVRADARGRDRIRSAGRVRVP